MHARVSTYAGPADRMLEGFRAAMEPLEPMEGFLRGYFLVDRVNNKGISIAMWESEEALVSSAARMEVMRKGATEPSATTIDSVENYEVAFTV